MSKQMTELQARLEGEVMEVEWDALLPHVQRDAVILIHPDVPLVKAAMAVGLDLKDDVAAWMAEAKISRIGSSEAVPWGQDERFRFLIVQPFVLVQRATTSEE